MGEISLFETTTACLESMLKELHDQRRA